MRIKKRDHGPGSPHQNQQQRKTKKMQKRKRTQESKKATAKVAKTVAVRGKVYGPPKPCLENIGLAWTAIIQQRYQIKLSCPIEPHIAALMMTMFKCVRSGLAYKPDNYVDGHAYLGFAQDFQKEANK